MWKKILLTLFLVLFLALDGLLIADLIKGAASVLIDITAMIITVPLIAYFIGFYKE